MDKTAHSNSKEVIEDSTRESLIAISHEVPKTDPTGEVSPTDADSEKANEPLSASEERYRAELISISDLPSPDGKAVLPPSPRRAKG